MTVDQRAKEFVAAQKSLVLATVNKQGNPTVSHAPFVRDNGNLYVYTSKLSRHTNDMFECSKTSAMIIEDEVVATNVFARRRITFSCVVGPVSPKSAEWREVMDSFSKTFGEAFEPMRSLGDFTLFCLNPFEVVYVEGFGRAFQLDRGLGSPVHVRGTGPGAKEHK
ncbi:MAG: pyridoxamine 5'-phosphate oxidase family protein [Candidatus Vogelbacteria bacterium]|nr:pyridoxamine 5'-phosphate oxidase family protein [Candidatus Vogelbacteria bacterium]